MPLGSDLADLNRITLDDLSGKTLMLIRRGWNEAMDEFRNRIRTDRPDIDIEDFPQYRVDAFNRCASSGNAIATLDIWRDANPMLKTLPTDWGVRLFFGVLHAPKPSEHVAELLRALEEIVGQDPRTKPA